MTILISILFWAGQSNPRRPSSRSFTTGNGKYNKSPKDLGRSLNFDDLTKIISSGAMLSDKFKSVASVIHGSSQALKVINHLNNHITGLVGNGENSGTNGESTEIPFISHLDRQSLGANQSSYIKYNVHLGKDTSSKIKKLADGPYIEKIKRLTADTNRDYLDQSKRKLLTLRTGFQEKGFTFLLDDTFFSIGDWYKIFKIDTKYGDELKNNHEGTRDIYGCILKTRHKFKIKSRLDFYNMFLKIHLVKINDINTDVRELISQTTHNKYSFDKAGKIPIDQQYTDPDFDPKNRFASSFLTTPNCRINKSTRFQERAKIVKTWTQILTPGSILEFNVIHHFGRGLHLNKIYDLQMLTDTYLSKSEILSDISKSILDITNPTNPSNFTNITNTSIIENIQEIVDSHIRSLKNNKKLSEHPTGYIFLLEYIGDRRCSVLDTKTKLYYDGYGPVDFTLDFETEYSYLANQDDEDTPLVYKRIRQEESFLEDTFGDSLKNFFYPDRTDKFHVPQKDLKVPGRNPSGRYKVVYDSNLLSGDPSLDLMDGMVDTFKEFGLDLKNLDLSGIDLKSMFKDFTNQTNQKEYEGTEGEDDASL